jgi:hypothetical protein
MAFFISVFSFWFPLPYLLEIELRSQGSKPGLGDLGRKLGENMGKLVNLWGMVGEN